MENAIVLYSTPEHLNSMSNLATFIAKHNQASIFVVMLSTAAGVGAPPVAYHRLPTPALPQNPTSDHLELSFEIPHLNNPNLKQALEEISHKSKIKAFIIDFFCNSAFEVSTSLNIPTYFCNTTGAFGLCVLLHWPTIHEKVSENLNDDDDEIESPGCPPINLLDLPKSLISRQSNSYKHLVGTSMNMRKSAGVIVNTFHALEFRAMEALANGLCILDGPTPPVYSLGPLIGGGDAGGEHECLRWLDLQPSKSVIFLCFGRGGVFSAKQLKEMAIGLENSGYRFLWVVRSPPEKPEEQDLDTLLPAGFLGRINKRGFVLTGWAPQMAVLGHDSVGVFVTHCGQSSILEAVSFGVPMIGWPLYAEQRMNRVFMVEEMKVAVALEMAEEDGFVTAAELERRVRELMESKTGREIRRRVTELKYSAAAAVREGGSSVVALDKFMETVTRV